MYFNVDGNKPVTINSSLNELYKERQRINKLIDQKEKELNELHKKIYKIEHGEENKLENNFACSESPKVIWTFPNDSWLAVSNPYENNKTDLKINNNKKHSSHNYDNTSSKLNSSDDLLTQSTITNNIITNSEF